LNNRNEKKIPSNHEIVSVPFPQFEFIGEFLSRVFIVDLAVGIDRPRVPRQIVPQPIHPIGHYDTYRPRNAKERSFQEVPGGRALARDEDGQRRYVLLRCIRIRILLNPQLGGPIGDAGIGIPTTQMLRDQPVARPRSDSPVRNLARMTL